MSIFDKNFKEILGSQMISIIGGLIAGSLLAIYKNNILLIPGMLILIPGFLEMRGNISGSFAARLSSGLFLGVVKPRIKHARIVKGNLIASFLLALFVSFTLGIFAFIFNYIFFHVAMVNIIWIPVIAGIIANGIEIPLTLLVTFYLFRKGHDPNNIMGPFVTSTGDITSVVALLLAVLLL